MAHLAVETSLGHTVPEVGDGKGGIHTDNTLSEFGKSAMALRTVLYQDRPLNQQEFHFMENHFRVLEMAYLRWKKKHGNMGINDRVGVQSR
ncbi:MAG: hypothetical protein ABIU05_17055 [Nitrospirales bacterium]